MPGERTDRAAEWSPGRRGEPARLVTMPGEPANTRRFIHVGARSPLGVVCAANGNSGARRALRIWPALPASSR